MSMENLENHAPITKVLEALRAGLSDYALQEYEETYGSEDYIKELKNALIRRQAYSKIFHNKEEAIQKIDPLGWVIICLYSREEVFKDKLGDKEKSYLELLREDRNIWGHQSPENAISNDDAYYTASTAARLLKAIGAEKEAEVTRGIAQELRIYSEREQQQPEKPVPANNASQSPVDSLNGQQHQAGVAVATAPVTKKEKAGNLNKTSPPQPRELQTRPSERTSRADVIIQRPIRQNQKVNRSAISIKAIILVLLILIVVIVIIAPNIIASLTIDECDPEILGQRYSGFNHALARSGCLLLELANP